MARQWQIPGGVFINEDGEKEYQIPGSAFFNEDQAGGAPAGENVPEKWHHYSKNIRSG